MKIILASKSPRRRELLSEICTDFDIITAETDETLPEGMHPSKGVEILAIRKGEPIAYITPANATATPETLTAPKEITRAKATIARGRRRIRAKNTKPIISATEYVRICLVLTE